MQTYLTDRKLKMSDFFVFEIKHAKMDKIFNFLKGCFSAISSPIRNLVNFRVSSRNSENLYFDGLVLSKAYKVLDEKVQKSYAS